MHCDVSHVDVLMLHIQGNRGLFSPVNQLDQRSGPYKLAGRDLFTYPEVPQILTPVTHAWLKLDR